MRHDERAQVQVIEAIIVGILVFVAIAIAAVFRVPTITGTFEQSELERLGTDVLLHLSAAVPAAAADCNETGFTCPFESELDRMFSLALRYQGPNVLPAGASEPRDTSPLADYFNQSLPDGARYIITYSNGVNATRIYPMTLTPPALDVVVAHVIVSPNWMQYSQQSRTSALIQIGEVTGFVTASTDSIRDPLNREREEWGDGGGRTHVSLMSDATGTATVPSGAVYGTYKFCADAACATPTYFTVVPPGVYGSGSSILFSDRDNSTSLVAVDPPGPAGSALFDSLKFADSLTADDLLTTGEGLYLDLTGDDLVSAGDLRMSDYANCVGATTCIAGTYVKTGEGDIGTVIEAFPAAPSPRPVVRALLGDDDDALEEGESVYLDVADGVNTDGDRLVGANDRRFSRVATLRSGSEVDAADFDVGRQLVTVASGADFTATNLYFGDTDLDGVLDAEEPIYLDFVGNGQDAGIESFDLRLSPRGTANLRYAYDMQVVIWFGI